MLSFQITESGKAIQIACDSVGMSVLLGALARPVGERALPVHLLMPGNGGKELNETTPHGEEAVGEVIIDYAEGD